MPFPILPLMVNIIYIIINIAWNTPHQTHYTPQNYSATHGADCANIKLCLLEGTAVNRPDLSHLPAIQALIGIVELEH